MFAPCEYLGHKFVDGGILDNVPTDEVKKLGVDKVITIKLSTGINYEPKNIYEVAFKAIDILCDARAEDIVKQSDFLIDLDVSEASVFNIKKIDYCYNVGYTTTLEKIEEIKEILEK